MRLPLRVHTERIGACLDLTVLFASLLEQAGLRPLILFKQGHAFAGCWLKPEDFSAPVVDDVQAIRKRRQLGEMLVFEVTLAAQTTPSRFSFACRQADEYLEDEPNFVCAVDIARARQSGIKPLVLDDRPAEPVVGASVASGVDVGLDIPLGLDDTIDDIEEEAATPPNTPDARVLRWKRKLLDLTLRNPLLNFRAERRAIRLLCHDPARLEDMVAAGEKIKILPLPDFGAGRDPRDLALRNRREQEDLLEQHVTQALARKELVAQHEKDDLNTRLTNLFRLAKAALEEGGANVLWLAIGMLSWKPQDARGQQGKSYRAPLIMVPVELVRRSVVSTPVLRMRDEEARVNDTLLQMLRQDFDLTISRLEGALPTDDSGLDVPAILTAARHAIRDLEGWELRDEVMLSTWSFAKFLMYRDLDARAAELKHAPVVKHLIETPDDIFDDGIGIPAPDTLDAIEPVNLLVPLDADSSQLAAIAAAANGKTFVTRGPPGTGKSQTIANIISHFLGVGKRVLFVAEKTAALEAVHSRLVKLGLGSYCLQLHSNKTSKAEFVAQLDAAWTGRSEFDDAQWRQACMDLKRHRDTLNGYVRALHKPYRNGWTVFRAIGEVTRWRDAPGIELGRVLQHAQADQGNAMQGAMGWSDPDTHTEAEYKALLDIVRRMDVDIRETGDVHGNPLAAVTTGDWSPSWQSQLLGAARNLKPTIDQLEHAVENFLGTCGLPAAPLSDERISGLVALPPLLQSVYGERYGELIGVQAAHVPKLKKAQETFGRYLVAMQQCTVEFERGVLAEPLKTLGIEWDRGRKAWWPKSFFIQTRVRRTLRRHTRGRAKPDPDRDLSALISTQQEALALDDFGELSRRMDWLWRGLDTDIEEVKRVLEWQNKARHVIDQLSTDPEAWEACRTAVVRLTVEQNERLSESGPVLSSAQRLKTVAEAFDRARQEASELAGQALAPGSGNVLVDLRTLADGWLGSEAKLRAWCAWRAARTDAIENDLGPVVGSIEQNLAPGMSAEVLFVQGYARWFLNAAVDRDDVLRHFVSREHELRIREFSELDERVREFTAEYIRTQLHKPVPRQGSMSATGDAAWGRLNREVNRRRGHTPIRKMLKEVPEPILTLTPCLMMSPISVAQYLDPTAPLFDLVLFDEASQIPTHDAIGALARARQAVVAGDDKQLPPTAFFDRQDDDDGDVAGETPEDLESVLDECRAARVPVLGLNWHYRSRDESLIAFSNHRYYDGSLITFPSPDTQGTAVQMYHIEGAVYDKGKSRTNRVEAEQVVAHVTRLMRDPANHDLSFGVVTFNSEQQTLIQDLMEAAVRADRSLEPFFSDDQSEAYFTKNLESVQGDERDIIIFSTTYGPDQLGKVSMNFGPLNKPGGQRRLNVAVSRAKRAMHVFASLRPEDIDLNRTAAEGVRDFKLFLDYAIRGPRSLLAGPAMSVGGFESPFEAQIAEALRAKGWTVHPQIGVSQFRIDLGIVHPDIPGRYLAGVECDGATYHRSSTARDRDLLREHVLRDLGWTILRIWSTDFWLDPAGTIETTDAELRQCLDNEHTQPDAEPARSEEDASFEESVTTLIDDEEGLPAVRYADAVTPPQALGSSTADTRLISYHEAPDFSELKPTAFGEQNYRAVLRRFIAHIIKHEGPIRVDVLARKVARAHHMARTGNRILARVKEFLPPGVQRTRDSGETIIWPSGMEPETWETFRTGSDRSVDEIPMEELVALAAILMDRGVRDADLVTKMGHELGLSRVRRVTRERLDHAADLAVGRRTGLDGR